MTKLVQDLVNASQRGTEELRNWLDANDDKITPELAEEARQVYKQALESGQHGLAANVAFAASLAFRTVNNQEASLRSFLDFCQIHYMLAEDTTAYDNVRSIAKTIVGYAEEIGLEDVLFQAMTLVANASFFAYQIESEFSKQNTRLLTTLEDVVEAAKHVAGNSNPVWFEEFVSLLVAVFAEVRPKLDWQEEELNRRDSLLRDLAPITELVIPVEFEYNHIQKDPFGAGTMLAKLSNDFGSPAAASARLSFLTLRAEEAGDIETWMQCVFDRYVGTRNSGVPKSQLKQLSRSLRERANEFRIRFHSRAGRLWAAQELDHTFGELLRDALADRKSNAAELFEMVDGTKARTLLDQITEGAVELPKEALSSEVIEMERQMLGFNPDERNDKPDSLSEMRLTSLLSIGTTWDKSDRVKVLGQLEESYAKLGVGFQTIQPVSSLEQITHALRTGEAIVEYCVPYHPTHPCKDMWALTITSKGLQVVSIPIEQLQDTGMIGRLSIDGRQPLDISSLGQFVFDLRAAIDSNDTDNLDWLLEAFYQLLINPLIETGLVPTNFRQWIVVPHGVLHSVPFGALRNPANGRHLIEEVALTMVPSASLWARIQVEQREAVTSFIGFANPDLSYCELPSLKDAEKEIEKISSKLTGLDLSIFPGPKATETALRNNLSGKSIVHIATHGEFPEDNVIDFHRLLLSATAEHDGRVNAEEICRINLHSARLVVLSICNGGLYRFGPGDEPYGLIPAILTGGAENVLGTLWPIADRIGRVFMSGLYDILLESSPAEALQHISKQFIKDKALVRDWAGFTLVGPGRAIV